MSKNKKRTEYEDYVLEVIDQVCLEHPLPIKQKYAEAVAKLKTQRECKGEGKFESSDVRPNVSKAIDRLCGKENPQLMCYKGKYYVPTNSKYLFAKLSEEYLEFLRGKICVDKRDVVLISHNTCAFYASMDKDYINEHKETYNSVQDCIAECVGDYCYAILGVDNFIQIMIKCTAEFGVVPDENSKEFAVIRALEDAVTRLYEETHNTLTHRKKATLSDLGLVPKKDGD